MPVPEGQITGSQIWVNPTSEEITEALPPEEVEEVIIEVETDEE